MTKIAFSQFGNMLKISCSINELSTREKAEIFIALAEDLELNEVLSPVGAEISQQLNRKMQETPNAS